MKKFKYLAIASTLAVMPFVAGAADGPTLDAEGEGSTFLNSVLSFINDVLIPLILGIAFLFFVWGMFQYFIAGGANDEAKEKGKSLLTYAILGFVVILVFWGIINLVVNSTGLGGDTLDVTPTVLPTGGTAT